MNSLIIITIVLGICCVARGSPTNCGATITAFPPDLNSRCCGIHGLSYSKILGDSSSVALDDFPWVVLIEYVKNGEVKTPCGGALISGQYVLTAAHCVSGSALNSVGKPEKIRLGEYDTSTDGPDCKEEEGGGTDCTDGAISIPIEKIIIHPEYNVKEHKNDIALIRMTRVAPYTDFIRPICLPATDITKGTGTIHFAKAAWGNLSQNTETSSVKQRVLPPFVPLDKCQAAFDKKATLSKTQICAGDEHHKDFCRDGGFPLAYDSGKANEITGIVSFGTSVCAGEIPVVYTKVYEYKSWINSNIVA